MIVLFAKFIFRLELTKEYCKISYRSISKIFSEKETNIKKSFTKTQF